MGLSMQKTAMMLVVQSNAMNPRLPDIYHRSTGSRQDIWLLRLDRGGAWSWVALTVFDGSSTLRGQTAQGLRTTGN